MSADDELAQAARLAFGVPCDAVVKLAPDNQAPVFVDARKTPIIISPDLPSDCLAPDCTWHGSVAALTRTLSSKRAVENAMINGRLVVSGDMSVMSRLHLVGGT